MDKPQLLKDKPSHPGEYIARVLMRNRRLSVSEIAKQTGISLPTLQGLIQGKENITPDMADQIRPIFGKVADSLLKLQSIYDYYLINGIRPSLQNPPHP